MSALKITAYTKERISTEIRDQDIDRIVEITEFYFPKGEKVRSIVQAHIGAADVIVLARKNDAIQGVSIASATLMQTPFSARPIHAVYQRMLFLAPGELRRRTGLRLGIRTFRQLMGWLWFSRHFVLFCRTMNPHVVKRIRLFNEYYPRFGEAAPAEIIAFAHSLAPLLEATEIDSRLKLINIFPEYRNIDATAIWNQYLQTHCREYDDLVLDGSFMREGERLIFTGNAQLLIGFHKPFGMLKLAFK